MEQKMKAALRGPLSFVSVDDVLLEECMPEVLENGSLGGEKAKVCWPSK